MKFFKFSNKVHLGAFIIILCVSFLFICNFDTSTSRILDEIFEYGHLPLFGLIALGFAMILNRNIARAKAKSFIYAWIITVLLGIATEVIQIITPGRFFEFRDITFNAIGAGCFLILAYPFSDTGIRVKKTFRAVALFFIIAGTIPIFLVAGDEITMHNDFPTISSFESCLEMNRWRAKESEISRSRSHATHGEYALQANLTPGKYPGISLKYLCGDWRGYDKILIDSFLPGNMPMIISIRIHDRQHNEEYEDRFNESFSLNPGKNTIMIKLQEVKDAPKGRNMDMAKIMNIYIFSYNLAEPRTLYFDNFRLE